MTIEVGVMASFIACPTCQARLKMSKLPSREKSIQCPKCGHPFTLSPSSVTASPPAAARSPHREKPSAAPLIGTGLAIGIMGAVLLAGSGIMLAFFLTRSNPETKIASSVPDQKEESPQQQKQEKLIEPKKVEEKEPEPDKDKARQFYTRLLVKAAREAEAKRFENAIAAYNDALKIIPGDEDARRGLQEAQTALAALNKTQADNQKLKEDAGQLVKQGQDSIERKQYAAAVEFFKLALQKFPADADAARGLTAAQEALAGDLVQQKKQAEFDAYINTGRVALKAGRFADAIREFTAAQGVLPGSPLAISLQRQAEQEMTLLKGQDERKQEYVRAMDQAGAALKNQRLDEADQAFRKALKLIPNDPAAEKGLAETQRLGKLVRDDFLKLMTVGNQAMRDMRYQDAILAFREANRLLPADNAASKALADAQQIVDRLAAYDQAMKRAVAAMNLNRYADAVMAFGDALKAIPNDPMAGQGLADAQRAFQLDANARLECDRKLNQAALALNQQKYADAVQLLGDAVRLQPNHPQIFFIQKQARYADAMGKGQSALTGQNYREAVRQFQIALAEFPGDVPAQAALTRARAFAK